jgi:hypothetical protein
MWPYKVSVNWDRESVYLSGHDDRPTDYSESMQLFMTQTDIEMMLGRDGNWHYSPEEEEEEEEEEEPPRPLPEFPYYNYTASAKTAAANFPHNEEFVD